MINQRFNSTPAAEPAVTQLSNFQRLLPVKTVVGDRKRQPKSGICDVYHLLTLCEQATLQEALVVGSELARVSSAPAHHIKTPKTFDYWCCTTVDVLQHLARVLHLLHSKTAAAGQQQDGQQGKGAAAGPYSASSRRESR